MCAVTLHKPVALDITLINVTTRLQLIPMMVIYFVFSFFFVQDEVIRAEVEEVSGESFPSVTPRSTNKDEKVFVVTPQPRGKALNLNKSPSKKRTINSTSFEVIEKVYQVLPQAVNNLAIASTGPADVPLWGVMELEEYAAPMEKSDAENEDEEEKLPILYGGHSKVNILSFFSHTSKG